MSVPGGLVCLALLSVQPGLTTRTDADELAAMAQDRVTTQPLELAPHHLFRHVVNIVDLVTMDTANVEVRAGISVESGLAAELEFLDFVVLHEDIEVPIDRAETHVREFPADHVVQLTGRRMTGHRPQLFEDHLSLSCLSTRLADELMHPVVLDHDHTPVGSRAAR